MAFRAYLLTTLRRLHVDRYRATSRTRPTDDLTALDPGVPFHDTVVEEFEHTTAARAFGSLPERWQTVLWHVEVEGMRPAQVAPLLAISANSVSALAYRAREGLRQAYLTQHAQDTEDETCSRIRELLGPYLRGSCSPRDAEQRREPPGPVPVLHGGHPRARRGQRRPAGGARPAGARRPGDGLSRGRQDRAGRVHRRSDRGLARRPGPRRGGRRQPGRDRRGRRGPAHGRWSRGRHVRHLPHRCPARRRGAALRRSPRRPRPLVAPPRRDPLVADAGPCRSARRRTDPRARARRRHCRGS